MSKITNIHLSAVANLSNQRILNNHSNYDDYLRLYEFSKLTYEKNLENLDICVLFNFEYGDIQQAFRSRMIKTYELWKEYYPCNILYTGTDTICLRKCDLFGKYKEFYMFGVPHNLGGFTLEQLRTWNPYNEKPAHIFNCDIRYFPSTLTQEFWDKLLKFAEKWGSFWHVEQNIYNRMFVDQDITEKSIIDSTKYGFQLPHGFKEYEQNGITLKNAKIVHFHSSKGIRNTHQRMIRVWNDYKEF